jgi:D-alanyl-D-alanine carboxypeptidase/Bacterial SH3 domain
MLARFVLAVALICASLGLSGGHPRSPAYARGTALSLVATADWTGFGSFYYLRAAPTSTAPIIGRVTRGSQVRILSGTTGASVGGNPWWYQVQVGSLVGYVSSNAVDAVGHAGHPWIGLATSDGDPTVTDITARRAPSLAAPVAARFPLGAQLTVLQRQDGDVVAGDNTLWYRVAQGVLPPVYVYSAYLKFARWGSVPPTAPLLSATAAVAIDLTTGKTLFRLDAGRRWRPASTVKIMTALVALIHLRPTIRLLIPDGIASVTTDVDGSSMGLSPGESFSLHDLLYGMLLPSGNDAAYTIAQDISGSQSAFAALMNAQAARLGLRNTHFTNPTGLDAPDEYISAADLIASATRFHRRVLVVVLGANDRYADATALLDYVFATPH